MSRNNRLIKKTKLLLSKEKGAFFKEWGGRIRVCLVYPNIYSVGMSNLGFQTLYRQFNIIDDVVCERAFMPEKNDIDEYRRTSTRLFSMETARPLNEFDIIAFSIPFEEDFINVPLILKMSGIPFFSRERKQGFPLVMAGGVAISLNPEPIADLMDICVIGESEGFVSGFVEELNGIPENCAWKREELLTRLSSLEGLYIPSFYAIQYDGALIKQFHPIRKGVRRRIKKLTVMDLDAYPTPVSFIATSNTEFGDTRLMEIERGCGRGCRFCAAGFAYLPPRNRSEERMAELIKDTAEDGVRAGLVGTAVSEYPSLTGILEDVAEVGGSATISSLRLDLLDVKLLALLKDVGYRTITIAPEAGSQRLRRVINKGISDEQIMKAVHFIADAGFKNLKLYFMIGLPTETEADINAIVDMARRIRIIMSRGRITLSINPFVPKPCTPFQWSCYKGVKDLNAIISIIRSETGKIKGINFKGYSPRIAYFQAMISRGDRRLADWIIRCSITGKPSFIKMEGSDGYVYRKRCFDEVMPWDFIDNGVKKSYLWNEYRRGLAGKHTSPCEQGSCSRCGVC